MSAPLLPACAQRIYAQIEDSMATWAARSADPSPGSLAALRTAIDRTGDLIVELQVYRDQLHAEYTAHAVSTVDTRIDRGDTDHVRPGATSED
ncbi:hypothetical protein CLV30_13144 [Haloactinopolyspora alba]|uniref:Uncharacterized protein n=1 Tax=Haloactinopolyspora alba TaxID=648780 RepID=A0A2P8D739_9ACTN|nr:hypothetical protein [Haloactinopolyspora alba]PSK93017.1 hypothetical protein CLV30_13144 [Haloactinopolyspora alba]